MKAQVDSLKDPNPTPSHVFLSSQIHDSNPSSILLISPLQHLLSFPSQEWPPTLVVRRSNQPSIYQM